MATISTVWGRLAIEDGLRTERKCSATAFEEAVKNAHQRAWERGESDFVFTRAMARAAGVI